MMGDSKTNSRFQDVVQRAAAQLVSLRAVGESSYVSTPILYPSGSCVIVRVDGHGSNFFVTDFGTGFEEASDLGAERTYRRIAKSVAERTGVRFDGHALFELEVTEGQLAGAISAIANASLEAVQLAFMKSAEHAQQDENAILHNRLSALFSSRFVARDAQILGGSNTKWRVSSLVTLAGSVGAFEAVSKHQMSVVSVASKFADIARSDAPPSRIAVVNSKEGLGTLLGVLTPNASVVEKTAPDTTIRRLLNIAA